MRGLNMSKHEKDALKNQVPALNTETHSEHEEKG
jgi:hypothetical protein